MNNLTRRTFVQGSTALAATGALTGTALFVWAKAWAQSSPWKPEQGAQLSLLRWKYFVQSEDDAFVALVDAFTKAITSRTKVLAFTHFTNTVGDLFPAKEICAAARERGVITLLDGAQTFGSLNVNLREIDPDFYSGSAHKWPCGARECGVLFINSRVHEKIWPSSYSAYPGAVGISRRMEMFGQRDEATMIAFAEALAFQTKVGRAAIEQRSKALAQQLLAGISKIEGFRSFTSSDPARNGAVVTFAPGTLDTRKLVAALYEKDQIGVTTGGGAGRSGIRVSPHFYNTPQEIDRLLAALARYQQSGL